MAMVVYTPARERNQVTTAIAPADAPAGFKNMLEKCDSTLENYLNAGTLKGFASATAKMCKQKYNDVLKHMRGQLHPGAGLTLQQDTHYEGRLTVKSDGTLQLSQDFKLTRLGKIQVLARSVGTVAREFVDWLAADNLATAVGHFSAFRQGQIQRKVNRGQHKLHFKDTVAAATHAKHPKRAAQRSSQDFQAALRHPEDKAAFGRSTKKEIIAANNGDPDSKEDHDFYKNKTANSLGTAEYNAKLAVLEAQATAMATHFNIPFNEAKMKVIDNMGHSLLPKDLEGVHLDAATTRKRNFNQAFASTGIDSTMAPAQARARVQAPQLPQPAPAPVAP